MGIYADHVFPRLMDRALSGDPNPGYREEALAGAHGRVLEIGFGTGLNLPHYPPGVEQLVAVDPSSALPGRVRERIERAPFPVERYPLDAGGRLPFPDAHFDTVASTWTLCSIGALGSALTELHRVLRPEGRLLFMEHGRSDHGTTARLQDLLNPVQRFVACGCNLNRAIDRELVAAGFAIERLERFRVPGVPRAFGEVYRGAASRG